jgi:hypothetical protein
MCERGERREKIEIRYNSKHRSLIGMLRMAIPAERISIHHYLLLEIEAEIDHFSN